jgi:hypothetical protein
MLTRDYSTLIKKATKIYNQDKLPALEIDDALAETMARTMFEQLRLFLRRPYHYKMSLPKGVTLVIRYRQIRNELNTLIQTAKACRDEIKRLEGLSSTGEEEAFSLGYETRNIKEIVLSKTVKLDELKAEIFYWYCLKTQYMDDYTKTPTYKRLQALRQRWRKRDKTLFFKEDYIENRITQVGSDKDNVKILVKEHKVKNKKKDDSQ